MNGALLFALAAIGGYLLGSIPFGVVITRAAGAGDVRNIVADVTEEMRLRAEVGTWRKIKAFPVWALRKTLEKGLEWAIVAGLVATATYLWTLLHR